MLAEIAIANAAFGVIKEAIGNGKDLYEMGGVVAQFFDQKTALQKKSNAKGYKSDMEAFMELEKIKEMEELLWKAEGIKDLTVAEILERDPELREKIEDEIRNNVWAP